MTLKVLHGSHRWLKYINISATVGRGWGTLILTEMNTVAVHFRTCDVHSPVAARFNGYDTMIA